MHITYRSQLSLQDEQPATSGRDTTPTVQPLLQERIDYGHVLKRIVVLPAEVQLLILRGVLTFEGKISRQCFDGHYKPWILVSKHLIPQVNEIFWKENKFEISGVAACLLNRAPLTQFNHLVKRVVWSFSRGQKTCNDQKRHKVELQRLSELGSWPVLQVVELIIEPSSYHLIRDMIEKQPHSLPARLDIGVSIAPLDPNLPCVEQTRFCTNFWLKSSGLFRLPWLLDVHVEKDEPVSHVSLEAIVWDCMVEDDSSKWRKMWIGTRETTPRSIAAFLERNKEIWLEVIHRSCPASSP